MKNQIVFKFAMLLGAMLSAVLSAQPAQNPGLTKAAKSEIIGTLGKKLTEEYIFPDVAAKVVKELNAKQKSGAYGSLDDPREFGKALTDDMRAIARDKHLGVRYFGDMVKDVPSAEVQQRQQDIQKHVMKVSNYGFRKVEILPGNIGYFKIDGFAPADLASGIAGSTMAFLANTDAMIIDLRENHGGEPEMVCALASYFFPTGVHLNDLYYRKGNKTETYRTKEIAGARYEKPVYILTSSHTFSGGEEFAYDFQTQKRGTLIGETTGGGANPGDEVTLPHNFSAFIPTGRAINPVTKTNWEGVGVVPDVAVPAADALQRAHEMALQSALQSAPEMHKQYYQRNLERLAKK